MRVLLDECMDQRLKRHIQAEVVHVRDIGWEGLSNGVLLRTASAEFDVLLTVDQNLPYQQSLIDLALAVIVLRPRRNKLSEILLLLPAIEKTLTACEAGKVYWVE